MAEEDYSECLPKLWSRYQCDLRGPKEVPSGTFGERVSAWVDLLNRWVGLGLKGISRDLKAIKCLDTYEYDSGLGRFQNAHSRTIQGPIYIKLEDLRDYLESIRKELDLDFPLPHLLFPNPPIEKIRQQNDFPGSFQGKPDNPDPSRRGERSDGWVRLHREQFSHWISKGKPWCDGYAWSYLYARANHKLGVASFKGKHIPVERGSFITSKQKLLEIFGWGKKRLNSFLQTLEKHEMISCSSHEKGTHCRTHSGTQQGAHSFLVITIRNYNRFQPLREEREPIQEPIEEPDREQLRSPFGATNNNNKNPLLSG
jgi:hypothetical protein